MSSLEESQLLMGLTRLGVLSAFPDLRDSIIDPNTCLDGIKSSLRFLGHTASKWRDAPGFTDFLERMSKVKGGTVQFLVSSSVSESVIDELAGYQDRYACFSARIHFDPPMFRLVEIDRRFVGVQSYPPDGGDSDTNWDRAGMLFRRTGCLEPLYPTFERSFDMRWNGGTPVAEFEG